MRHWVNRYGMLVRGVGGCTTCSRQRSISCAVYMNVCVVFHSARRCVKLLVPLSFHAAAAGRCRGCVWPSSKIVHRSFDVAVWRRRRRRLGTDRINDRLLAADWATILYITLRPTEHVRRATTSVVCRLQMQLLNSVLTTDAGLTFGTKFKICRRNSLRLLI